MISSVIMVENRMYYPLKSGIYNPLHDFVAGRKIFCQSSLVLKLLFFIRSILVALVDSCGYEHPNCSDV